MLNEQHVLIGYSYGNAWIIIQLVRFSLKRLKRIQYAECERIKKNPIAIPIPITQR